MTSVLLRSCRWIQLSQVRYYPATSKSSSNSRREIKDVRPLSVSEGVTRKKQPNLEKLFGTKDPMMQKDNPGIDQYLKAMGLTREDLESCYDSEYFDPEEGLFEEAALNDPASMNHVKKEIRKIDKRIKHRKVQRTFFREPPETNLLTWAAKQQIRFLNQQNPEEWTPEKLAESFPISVPGVKKLLRSEFVVASEERIRKHDQSVIKNWENLRNNTGFISPVTRKLWLEGKLSEEHACGNKNLPVSITKELNKMSDLSKPRKKEFVSIVKTYLNVKQKTPLTADTCEQVNSSEKEEYVRSAIMQEDVMSASYLEPKGFKSGVPVTFENFRKQQSASKANPRNSVQNTPRNRETKLVEGITSSAVVNELKVEKYNKNNEIYRNYTPQGSFEAGENIKTRIKIPKSKSNQNGEYRYGDCIYDEDGEFLYRVPM